ncbi:hypothetical protein BJY00DRAFT_317503 [Aspergillus carlsbadensis]|nr:hypothetical protein BJY00DRAFT_317503 [Aspergillus carlsbadensis]
MSNTQQTVEVYIGRSNHKDQPEHWILILRAPKDWRCTFIHSTAETLAWPEYTRAVEYQQRFEHWKIAFRDKISLIRAEDASEVIAAATAVEPQHCQRYIIALLEKLEGKGLVPGGTADSYRPMVQPLLHEGPVREVTKAEFEKLVVERGGKSPAIEYLLELQGWVDEHGDILWNYGG